MPQVRVREAEVARPPQSRQGYDLEERTARFAEEVIRLCRSIPETAVTRPLISQLVSSAGSVGANYCEADDAESKKDFTHKISICRKEARETKHWLRLIAIAVPERAEEARRLLAEARELHLIFAAIRRSSRGA